MKSVGTARNVPRTSVCHQLHMRHQRLVRILDEQIVIAERLSQEPSAKTSEAKYAWDAVEELSQKLDKISKRLDNCLCEEQDYYARQDRDIILSEREHDL